MTADEPDISALFAPVDITTAVRGALDEAQPALADITDPVDAELWGSDVIGALSAAGGPARAMSVIADTLVPAAEQAAGEGGVVELGVLRVLAALGDPALRAAAAEAADRVSKLGVQDPPWATDLGSPAPGACWHYADVGGRQESVTLTFAYGQRQHAISVLLDHTRDGKLKDVWLTKGSDQLQAAELAAGSDPLVIFELLDLSDAADRVRKALSAGDAPEQPDQADDISAHRALLRARCRQL